MPEARLLFRGLTAVVCIIACLAVTTCSSGPDSDAIAATDECEDRVGQWRIALQEANDTIEQLNNAIEEAQAYAGASEEEMTYALESLETGDTVAGPE
jgi:uncharacterized protein YlxW (UPF0749 family)